MSSGKRSGFLENIISNIRDGFGKDEKLKENLKAFREQTKKLEDSDALKQARQKYKNIESESSAMKQKLEELQKKAADSWEEAQKNEMVKKAGVIGSKVAESASKAAETAKKTGESIGKTDVFKTVTDGVKSVKEELDEAAKVSSRHYTSPHKLKKRSDLATVSSMADDKVFDADTESTGMVMHKDSKWSQNWQNFKDNNQYMHKMFDLKTQYDESDNIAIRMTRSITDKIGHVFGSVSKTELSAVLTEICKIDPEFDKEQFLKFCKADVIPNVLEAMLKGHLDILEDWCFEAPYNILAEPIKQAKKLGYIMDSQVLDVEHVDLHSGQMMEQGPVLLITFQTQQVMAIRDKSGKVVEGDPEKVLKFTYVWALCRNQEDFDPKSAWRILELSAMSTEQWL
ncbi:mitochondrial import inner membrane translocase subunit TIM44-like [Watersipora subatra]|uniref:mitochondrial import inner membrane translocase subunit TIM44-like n=1 Tax=Watersipora subatra TaxID=2589382 RepID=UPI00355B7B75